MVQWWVIEDGTALAAYPVVQAHDCGDAFVAEVLEVVFWSVRGVAAHLKVTR